MVSSQSQVGEEYVRLALAMDAYIPGYVDAYYGPPEWKAQASAEAPSPLPQLEQRLSRLADLVEHGAEPDEQRRDYLRKQVRAMQGSLRIAKGEKLALLDEAEALFDISPVWIDEALFEEAHQILEELLPPGGSLHERMNLRKKAAEISIEQAEKVLPYIIEYLRELTRCYFPLPEGEAFELRFVKDQPWGAYNWFLGGGKSLIEINTDLPLYVTGLAGLIAHEGYPGHHTELSNKELRLFQQAGYLEHSIALIQGPSALVSEGIANYALKILMNDDEQVEWNERELFPRAGFPHIDALREKLIRQALQKLSGVAGNAVFLLYDRGSNEQEVIDYIQRYGLNQEREARKLYGFISKYRTYIFNYSYGYDLLEALFSKVENPRAWFKRLLTEPVTPSQIRGWISENSAD